MLQWFGTLADGVLSMGLTGVYLALLIEGAGLPFPGDIALAFYGFAAADGRFHPGSVLLFAIVGYLSGTLIVYGLSLRYGSAWLERFSTMPLFNARSMTRTTRLIDRYGPLLLVPGRFLPGVRSVSSYVAGLTRMDFRLFLIYTGIGVTLWCSAWVGLGYWFGDHMKIIVQLVQSWLSYATGALLITGFSVWIYRRKHAR